MPSRTRALLPAKSTTQGFGGMRIELGFPVEYDVQLLSELPAKRGVDHEISRRGKIIDGGVMIAVVTGAGVGPA